MRLIWACVGVGLVFSASAQPPDAQIGVPIAAVWKEQHLNFYLHGPHLALFLRGLARQGACHAARSGGATRSARHGARLRSERCAGAAGILLGPSLDLVFSAPALPDPAAKPLHPGDLAAVDARFEAFTIANDAFRNMGVADCELVEEFTHQILPRLVTRNLKQDISCVPLQQSGSRFLVRGQILRTLAPR